MAAHVPSKLRKKFDWLFRRAEGALLSDAILSGGGAHLDPDGARLALRASADDLEVLGEERRFSELLAALSGGQDRDAYRDRYGVAGVRRFRSSGGAIIYQLAVETFPRHVNNVYLVVEPGSAILVDCGSGLPSSRRDLALAFDVIRDLFDEAVRLEDVSLCLLSHAHIDHFGGANELRRICGAGLAVHELDAPAIVSFEERLTFTARALDAYWLRAGVDEAQRKDLGAMYVGEKALFRSEPVARTLRDGDLLGPGYRVHHVPGHCPGLVCLEVHDVLLTSDHVLARITPHQFPEEILPFAGLSHYFRSLEKIRAHVGVRLALGGHEEPIVDLRARIDEIALFHRRRLDRVRSICATWKTVQEIALELFAPQEGYGVILALDEAGAHVDHLAEIGEVGATQDGDVTRYRAR